MSDTVLNRFEWAKAVLQAEGLSGTAKNIAAAISLQFANDETGQINPSQETLADYLKVHRDTIKRAMRELRNAGWMLLMGTGGRGKAPQIRLLTPGKIIPFRRSKGGTNHPVQDEKRGGDLQLKGRQITPPHYKEEQSLEQRGRPIPKERPLAVEPHMKTRFFGKPTEGPRVVPKSDWVALNAWSEFMSDHGFPKPIDLPLVQQAEKGGGVFFYLPSARPPGDQAGIDQALSYFAALIDFEAARHAAQ